MFRSRCVGSVETGEPLHCCCIVRDTCSSARVRGGVQSSRDPRWSYLPKPRHTADDTSGGTGTPPPPGCRDPRLWIVAQEIATYHSAVKGQCQVCGTASPCRSLEAAQDAIDRAAPPPPPEPPPQHEPDPVTPPRRASPPPVGARFPRNSPDEDTDSTEPQWVAPTQPTEPVGARFPRIKEPKDSKRRRRHSED